MRSEFQLELRGDDPAIGISGETTTDSETGLDVARQLDLSGRKQLMTLMTAFVKPGHRPEYRVVLETDRLFFTQSIRHTRAWLELPSLLACVESSLERRIQQE